MSLDTPSLPAETVCHCQSFAGIWTWVLPAVRGRSFSRSCQRQPRSCSFPDSLHPVGVEGPLTPGGFWEYGLQNFCLLAVSGQPLKDISDDRPPRPQSSLPSQSAVMFVLGSENLCLCSLFTYFRLFKPLSWLLLVVDIFLSKYVHLWAFPALRPCVSCRIASCVAWTLTNPVKLQKGGFTKSPKRLVGVQNRRRHVKPLGHVFTLTGVTGKNCVYLGLGRIGDRQCIFPRPTLYRESFRIYRRVESVG